MLALFKCNVPSYAFQEFVYDINWYKKIHTIRAIPREGQLHFGLLVFQHFWASSEDRVAISYRPTFDIKLQKCKENCHADKNKIFYWKR